MNKLILTPILVLVLAVAARAQLYDNGLLVNRSNLISNWQMPTVVTAGGAYTGVSGVFEHRGPSVRTLVNDGTYRTTGSHTDRFMGPGGQPGAQEIAGTNRPLFRNLQLINGAGQLLNITNPAGISVSQSLTFANGITTTLRSYTQAGAIVLGDSATYTGGNTDAQHVNGYVSKIGSTSFTFPVGSGTDSRPLTISAPGAATDHYSVAWIMGDPTTTVDPSGTPALHPVANREASLMAVSTIGQWDWIAVSGTGAGLTITVPLPDLTAFSAATDLRLVGWNGNQWINLSTGAKPYLNGTSYASGNADGATLQGTMVAGITAIGIGGAPTISLSGQVFDDGNGLTDNVVNQTGNGPNPLNGTDIDPTTAGNQSLYATLLNSSGTPLTSVAVTSTGTYAFSSVAAGTYSVQLSTQATIATGPALPQNWVYTGEQLGTGPGSDGTPNGILTGVVVGTASVGQANFGINKRPAGAIASIPAQPNPGAGNQVVVPATVFTGTDLEDGPYANNLTGRTVSLSAATGGTLYYAGQAVSTTVVITNFDPAKVTLDPTSTQATTVQFTYTVRDNAGTASDPTTSPSVISAPFTTPALIISGNVFDDGNGLTDNTVNGSGLNGTAVPPISGSSPVPLYVSLWIEATKIATVPVSSAGTYSFTNVMANAAYYAILSTNPAGGDINNRPLPAGWVNTGENIGTGAGNDGLVDGILSTIALGTASVSNANFGIDRRPEGADVTLSVQSTPGGTAQVTIPPTAFTGTDLEDGPYANNLTGRPVSLSAAIGGTLYYAGNPVSTSLAIASFNPAQLTVDPTATGTTSVSFAYSLKDNAGVASFPARITVPFTGSVLSISGNVFDDGNGLTDGLVNPVGASPNPLNGTDIDLITPGNQALYATLVSTATAVATVAITNTGTYSFSDVAAGTYSVVLSTNASGSTTASLPANWVNTGEQIGTAPGSDGTPNGILTGVVVGTASVGQANVGIDQRPEAVPAAQALQRNPGGTAQATVFASVFMGRDLEDGTYADNLSGRTVSLSPATGGTLFYRASRVSVEQVITNFDPAQVTLDPTATGSATASFSYAVKDNAGVLSAAKSVVVPFFNDEDQDDDPDNNDGDSKRIKLPEFTFFINIPPLLIPPIILPPVPIFGILIPSFPTNVSSLTANGTVYTKDTFPPEGVVVKTDDEGELIEPVVIKVIDPAQPAGVPFKAVDKDRQPLTTLGTVVILAPRPDLTPIVIARPTSVYGRSAVNMVVSVVEVNAVASNGLITVRIPKDPKLTLDFNAGATSVNGRPVKNSAWTFTGPSGGFYTLTTSQVIAAGDVLSVGLTGTMTPGATAGTLTMSAIVVGGSGGEARLINNSDADKIEYFQQ